jgi:hypothetical protein
MTLLNDENYKDYAIMHYDNPICQGMDEFEKDLEERTRWIKRLLRKYNNGGELRELLILNHIVGFYNTFPGESGTKLLFYKIDEDLYPALKTFILYLNMEDYHISIHETITFRSIKIDNFIKKRLDEEKWDHQR